MNANSYSYEESFSPSNSLWLIRKYEQCNSTMDEAMFLARDHQEFGLITSKQQLLGRGRQGRVWESAKEGFYGTIVCPRTTASMLGLPLAVGVFINCFFKERNLSSSLKWPNDILTSEGKKIAGILIEQKESRVLIGVGINLQDAPQQAADLQSSGLHTSVTEIEEYILFNFASFWRTFEESGFTAFREEWLRFAVGIGEIFEIRVTDDNIVEGECLGVSLDGALLVREGLSGTIHEIYSGHVLSWGKRCE